MPPLESPTASEWFDALPSPRAQVQQVSTTNIELISTSSLAPLKTPKTAGQRKRSKAIPRSNIPPNMVLSPIQMPSQVEMLQRQVAEQKQQLQQLQQTIQLLQSHVLPPPIVAQDSVFEPEDNVEQVEQVEESVEQPVVEDLSKKTLPSDAYVEFKSAKQKIQRSIDGYQFRQVVIKRSGQENREEWRCTNKNCRVQAKFGDQISFSNLNEDGLHPLHAPNGDKMTAKVAFSRLQQRVRKEKDPVPQLWKQEVTKVHLENEEATKYFPQFRNGCGSGLYNQRHATYPTLPKSIFELMVMLSDPEDLPDDVKSDFTCDVQRFKKTLKGEKFLQDFNMVDENCYLLFADKDSLTRLDKRRTWFVDATFRVVPHMFYQLFTIHTRENDTTVPCAYIVMNGKSTEAYEDVFKAIKKLSKNDPETIHVDFEEAIHKAIKNVFPRCSIIGCNFHWNQACLRNVKSAGLYRQFVSKDVEVHTLIRRFLSVPHLPVALVAEVVEDLCHQVDETKSIHKSKLQEFVQYWKGQWLGSVATWNVHAQAVRTTNGVEGFHSGLNREVSSDHPNMWLFIELLQNQQAFYAAQLAEGLMKVTKAENKRERDLQSLWGKLYPEDRTEAPMDLMEYLDRVSRNLLLELV